MKLIKKVTTYLDDSEEYRIVIIEDKNCELIQAEIYKRLTEEHITTVNTHTLKNKNLISLLSIANEKIQEYKKLTSQIENAKSELNVLKLIGKTWDKRS